MDYDIIEYMGGKKENLSRFIEESPYGSTDWGGTRMVLLEDAYGDNIFWGGKARPCFAARAVNEVTSCR